MLYESIHHFQKTFQKLKPFLILKIYLILLFCINKFLYGGLYLREVLSLNVL